MSNSNASMDAIDRAIVEATQGGLPLCPQPYHEIARRIAQDPALVMDRLRSMLERGVIRRIGVVPNHYALGWRANGMTVWDVTDEQVDRLGERVGALAFVSHCYRRPRRLPDWPYNLFAMVHGHDRDAVQAQIAMIAGVLGDARRAHDTLYSTHILKKTGLRI